MSFGEDFDPQEIKLHDEYLYLFAVVFIGQALPSLGLDICDV